MTKCEMKFLEKYILPVARMDKLNFKSGEISVVQDIRFSYRIVVKFYTSLLLSCSVQNLKTIG